MQVRWTDPAVSDLTHICDYIEQHGSSATARRVALSIYESLNALVEFPRRGRQGGWLTLESTERFWVAHPCGFCKGGASFR
jgi:plasmid stabilization system protein ParE